MADTDYVLGTHDEEIARLGLQHRIWRPQAALAWRHAGFREGQTLIDLGSGPGYASLDLAEIVGPAGRVIALERSDRFIAHLEAMRRRRRLTQVDVRRADLDEPLPLEEQAQGLWCRWVCAFVRDPRTLISRVGDALVPGAIAIFHEYSEYRTWRMLPALPEHDAFVDLVIRAWRAGGGEPDVGRSLPAWLEQSGFEVTSLRPIVEVVTPADSMWEWPKAFVRSGSRRLAQLGQLEADRARRTWDAFVEAEARPGARMITPTVLEVVARRR